MSEAARVSVQLPVLDLSGRIEPWSLDFLSRACQEWGFFCVTNHGISKSLFTKVFSLSEHVFTLPAHSKLNLGPTYISRFRVSPYIQSLRLSGPDFLASANFSATQLFGHRNTEFEETMQEYGSKMTELAKRIMDTVLMSLGDGQERKLYESDFSNCDGYLRMVNYSPPPDEDVEGEEEVEGLGMHTDLSCITILCQDEVGGLQLRSKDGEWTDIPPREGSLVVNVGDLLQAWSNGRLRSSQHRVVLRPSVIRQSIAFFWCFEKDKVIVAPEEVVGEGNSRIYKPFLCSEYLKFRQSHENIRHTVYDFAGLELGNQ